MPRAALVATGALLASVGGPARVLAGGSIPPAGVGTATPDVVSGGQSSQLIVTVTPGSRPASTGLAVRCDLSSLGDPAAQALFDDGAHDDGAAGDLRFGFVTIVADGVPPGAKSLACAVTDAEGRSGALAIALTVIATCGDGVVTTPETCDDGGTEDSDGCDDACALEPGWTCADAPSDCAAICGDGVVVGSDECDDGGVDDGDGCDAGCAIEPGFACRGAPSLCEPASLCGNGVVEPGEQCDDLAPVSGDGCDATCTVETGYACDGAPSLCADPDGVAPHDLDGDHVHDALDNCPGAANPSQADLDDDDLGDACDDHDDRVTDEDAGGCSTSTAPSGRGGLALLGLFTVAGLHRRRRQRGACLDSAHE